MVKKMSYICRANIKKIANDYVQDRPCNSNQSAIHSLLTTSTMNMGHYWSWVLSFYYLMAFEWDVSGNVGLTLLAEDPTVDHQVEMGNVGVLVVPAQFKGKI